MILQALKNMYPKASEKGAQSGHERSRKVPWKEYEHRGTRRLDREARDSAYH